MLMMCFFNKKKYYNIIFYSDNKVKDKKMSSHHHAVEALNHCVETCRAVVNSTMNQMEVVDDHLKCCAQTCSVCLMTCNAMITCLQLSHVSKKITKKLVSSVKECCTSCKKICEMHSSLKAWSDCEKACAKVLHHIELLL